MKKSITMIMKQPLLILSLAIIFFITTKSLWANNNSLLFSLATLFFSFLFFFLNYWLVPGGLAWSMVQKPLTSSVCPRLGPTGWPIMGSFFDLVGPLAHRKLAKIACQLGATNLMALSAGPATRVAISSDPGTARQILTSSSFCDRPIKESAKALMFDRAIGFAPGGGSHWRRLRRISAVHLFSRHGIGGLEGLRGRVCDTMLERVGAESSSEFGYVVLRNVLQEGSLRNVLESVFGCCDDLGVDISELGKMVKEGYELISEVNLEDYFGLGFFDFFGVKRRCYILASKVRSVVGQIVKERKNKVGIESNDFLSSLLSLPKEDQLTEFDMVAVLWELIFRGTDTVAILLEWIMARMVMHQDIQTKVQQEIDTCVGTNRHVRDSDMQNLPFLQAVVKEVLRLHPPGPLLSWARLAVNDIHVDKVFIPAGTTAMVNMWAITHDPSVWKDPWTFKPERFMEEEVSVMGSDPRLAPFGMGRRVCPGRELGFATVRLWLARFLQDYTWLPAQQVDLSECLKLSMEMKKPLVCHVARRR